MRRHILTTLMILAFGVSKPAFAAGVQSAQAGSDRIALVIGNDTYGRIPKLSNARADANAIANSLREMGFEVYLRTDLDDRGMRAAMREFAGRLSGGSEAVFYFAGHGVQIGAVNYLLPTNIQAENEAQVRDDGMPLQRVLDELAERKVRFSVVILDACRDNPFPRATGRSIGIARGLAPTTAATGQMVLFSAGSGQSALDRLGPADRDPNGLFTRVLLKEMRQPGVPVDQVLRRTRQEVVRLAKSVGHEQVPALYDQTIGEFFFRPGGAISLSVPTPDMSARRRAENQYQEALVYAKAEGASRNDKEAVRLFRLAANEGHGGAQAMLGVMYATGRGGLPKDHSEAIRLYRLSADQGDQVGQLTLGNAYFNGRGDLPKDEIKAVRLWRLAAAQDSAAAQINLASMYMKGGGGLPKDEVEAVRLLRLAADRGASAAQVNLGVMYEEGRGGLPKSDADAIRLYKAASALGNAVAITKLGLMYENGRGGLKKDAREAVRLYEMGAAQNYLPAQEALKRIRSAQN